MVVSWALKYSGMTLSQVAKKIQTEKYSGVGKAMARFEERDKCDAKLRMLLHKAKSALSYVQAAVFVLRMREYSHRKVPESRNHWASRLCRSLLR